MTTKPKHVGKSISVDPEAMRLLLKYIESSGQVKSVFHGKQQTLVIYHHRTGSQTKPQKDITFVEIPNFSIWLKSLRFPEEAIAELIALKNRRQKQNIPQWKIYCELVLCEILPLLWAIHIQIRLQKLQLPTSKKRTID
jgi:hypothetical protein